MKLRLTGKDDLLNDPENNFAKLLYLYYQAMNHAELNQCLKILYTQTYTVPMKQQLTKVLR